MSTAVVIRSGMADKEDQGRHYMKKAEEKLKGWSLFNKKGKYEDAALLFVDAANAFKMAKKSKSIYFVIFTVMANDFT
jgi:hypothetical protein